MCANNRRERYRRCFGWHASETPALRVDGIQLSEDNLRTSQQISACTPRNTEINVLLGSFRDVGLLFYILSGFQAWVTGQAVKPACVLYT